MSASHGNTPAAWTAVAIMFVGFLLSGIALPLELPWLRSSERAKLRRRGDSR